ncbi:hypothetical protein OQJ19_08375 [Fluoribacter gormanii]|uniref:Uncharacterized protein n=1 Tax=Fluoribacter gormanii TaxID=464 RepID=A0A377GN26_9GAMM|nr:hypothetical protein [Fluoribacter gormanii]KTD04780.1 hypothetical protein Lgor_0862 [Fluoribacter gormanii]MCW8470666.1 hypothetical protein [Fluoribacter gormanii]SIR16888.1 hypothetical protein SAMN05421777_10799 [Fluoribacter gormanii]STO26217.1 Uncharacterised protein [Fluoribacter gormanii]
MLNFFKTKEHYSSQGRNYAGEKYLNTYADCIEKVIKDPTPENIKALKDAGNNFTAAIDVKSCEQSSTRSLK